jgi:hypothetical protein
MLVVVGRITKNEGLGDLESGCAIFVVGRRIVGLILNFKNQV